MKISMDGYKDKEILVTGGLGFVGSNIVIRLVDLGAKVTIIDNMLEGSGANLDNIKDIRDKTNLIIGDIRNDEDVKKAIMGKEIIFNCAAQVSHVISMNNPYLDIDINLKGNLTLLENCRKFNDKAKIVYTGTRGQMGKLEKIPADETHKEDPTDVLGINKLAAEHYHIIYHGAYGIRTTSLRLVNTFGPRSEIDDPKHNIVNWLIGRAIKNEKITVYEPGTQKRDCNYVEDVVDALLLAGINEKSNGRIYNIGSGRAVEFVELVKKIIEIAGTGIWEFVVWPKERKSIEVGDSLLSFDKIKKDLGWAPKTSLEEGLKKTINFYRKTI